MENNSVAFIIETELFGRLVFREIKLIRVYTFMYKKNSLQISICV